MTDELLDAEMRRYSEAYQKMLYADPDVPNRVAALEKQGFGKIHPAVITKIVRGMRTDAHRWFSTERGKKDYEDLLNVAASERRSVETFNRILSRLDSHKPFAEYRPEKREEDKWIEAGKERRRARRR